MKCYRKTVRTVLDKNNSPYEHCIACGKELTILKTTPIDMRGNYMIGGGQLCEKCYCATYAVKDASQPYTDEELLRITRRAKR